MSEEAERLVWRMGEDLGRERVAREKAEAERDLWRDHGALWEKRAEQAEARLEQVRGEVATQARLVGKAAKDGYDQGWADRGKVLSEDDAKTSETLARAAAALLERGEG